MNSHSRNLRIFLDIGGYHGHSSLAALDPIFAFDRVFCFEPVPELAKKIREISDPRLVVVEAALSDINGKAVLHHAGTLAGSLFSEAETYGEEGQELEITTLQASTFLPTIVPTNSFVRAKFNCEGAEALIINDIVTNSQTDFCRNMLFNSLLDFDISKISKNNLIKNNLIEEEIKSKLHFLKIPFLTPPDCQYGMITNYGGVRNFLICSGACETTMLRRISSAYYNLKMALNTKLNGYHKMRLLRALPLLRFVARTRRA